MATSAGKGNEPKRVSASLSEAARLMGAQGAVELSAVRQVWPDIVGPQAAAHLWPKAFVSGVLTVAADHHAWAAELRIIASDLQKRLQVTCPSVRSVIVVVSPGQGLNW
jgi:predicted nucleic acid-binding Zn ribbon protein